MQNKRKNTLLTEGLDGRSKDTIKELDRKVQCWYKDGPNQIVERQRLNQKQKTLPQKGIDRTE